MSDYNLGKAQGEIVLNFDDQGTEKAVSGIEKVGGAAKSFAKVAVGTVAAVGGVVAGLAISGGISRALNIQDAQAKLKGLGHDTQSIEKIMNSALASVKGTAFGLDEAAGVAATAVAAGIKPGQDLTKYLTLTADAATIAGTSLGEMGSILNKATTSGKVYTDILNQLSDRGIPVFQYLQKEYGVTADELSDMVKKGEVDSATLNKVLQENLGGAALSSGETARGAFKNVGAALSRLGVGFVAGPVATAPTLFTSIAGAVDRLATALKPAAAFISENLATGMAELAFQIDKIDFDVVVANITAGASKARAVVAGIISFVRDAVATIQAGGGVKNVDFAGLGSSFESVKGVVAPLAPIFVALAKGLGSIAGSVGQVITAGLPVVVQLLNLFADALNFLGEHPAVLAATVVTLGAAFGIYRASQVLATAATAASIPIQIARIAADVARTRALNANTDATLLAMGAERQSTAARLPATASVVYQTAAFVASKAALVATAIATRAAAAAQWIMNAALTANPIGIVVVAIAALVAGLIYFFTQTKAGQAIISGFVSFLGSAWEAIKTAAVAVFNFLTPFFQAFWAGLVTLAQPFIDFFNGILLPAIQFVIGAVIAYFQLWATIISTVVTAIIGFLQPFIDYFTTYIVPLIQAAIGLIVAIFQYFASVVAFVWNGIVAFLRAVVAGIVGFVIAYFQALYQGISALLSAIGAFFRSVWNAISSFVSGIVKAIVATIIAVFSPIVARIAGIFNSVKSTVSGILGAIAGFVGGIVGRIVGNVANAMQPVVSKVGAIFDGVKSAIKNKLDAAVELLSGVKNRVVSAFSGAGSWLLQAGKNIMQGLIDGVTGMITGLTDKLKGITKLIPKSKGPEKVDKVLLFDNGQMILQSLINGIMATAPTLRSALGNLTSDIPGMAAVPTGAVSKPVGGGSGAAASKTVTNNFTVNNADNPDAWLRAIGRELDGDV